MNKRTINGVDITEDGNVTHFTVSDDDNMEKEKESTSCESVPTSLFGRILNWFRTSKVTPYAKTRDLADPFGDRENDWNDIDAGSDGRTAAEIGIKIRF